MGWLEHVTIGMDTVATLAAFAAGSRSDDDIDRTSNQLGRLRWQTIILAISEALLD